MKYQVSIIIPTYNRSALLKQTLISVQKQSLSNWECIVVDDGSIDDTDELMEDIILDDNRFHYYKRPEGYLKGACSCRNYGFSLCSGKYIQWLDDDDLLSENKLELQVNALEESGNHFIFTSCDWDLFWPGKKLVLKKSFPGNEIKKEFFLKALAEKQQFIPLLAYLIPYSLHKHAGEWNINLNLNDDAEYITRVLLKSDKLINVQNCYVLYREHGAERISRKRSPENIRSFFLSLELMQSYLKSNNMNAKPYFKWKLMKWFQAYHKIYPEIFKNHYYLFKENGIHLSLGQYYLLKHKIYKKIYPFYKRLLEKKQL